PGRWKRKPMPDRGEGIRRLDTSAPGVDAALSKLIAFDAKEEVALGASVDAILADVRVRGDAAVLDYTARFDRVHAGGLASLELTRAECRAALEALPTVERVALESAAARIRSFHERQRLESWMVAEGDGTRLGQKITPLDRVG